MPPKKKVKATPARDSLAVPEAPPPQLDERAAFQKRVTELFAEETAKGAPPNAAAAAALKRATDEAAARRAAPDPKTALEAPTDGRRAAPDAAARERR